jgi:DNA-binding NarL/FixJ family response regulator
LQSIGGAGRPAASVDAAGPDVTQRQRHILELLVRGHSDRVIANRVCVSGRTLQREIRFLLTTLGARTRPQAVAEAMRRGWIER